MVHDGGAGTDQKLYESRECYLSETLNGVRDLKGRLDPLGGKILETALDAEVSALATDDLIAEARARRNDHDSLSATMLELLMCDCAFSRLVVAGRSEILDVGRATPTVSAAQWKALVVRDRHCQASGCTRPPTHCDAHHIRYWEHGGPTNLENLQLLCWHHHRQRHTQEAKASTGDGRDRKCDIRTRGP